MAELFYGIAIAVVATAIEPKGIRAARWWLTMLALNAIAVALRNGY